MRHERQVLIQDWDQDAIETANAVIIGCGSLGSSLAITLARLGVGCITLIDPDTLEEHNLENQAYTARDVGKSKVDALATRIHAIDPGIHVTTYRGRVQQATMEWQDATWFGCLDNVAARHWLNYQAILWKRTYIDAGIQGFQGAIKTVKPGKTSCYACHPILPEGRLKASCSQDPIPSTYVTANAVANLQAMQFLKLLHEWPWKDHVSVDLKRSSLHENNVERNPDCDICSFGGDHGPIQ